MTAIAIAVVAHPRRYEMARELANLVGAECVSWDDAQIGCAENQRRAWEYLKNGDPDSWSVVLEDDAQPVAEFRNQLKMALARAPSPVVSLYLGRGRPPHWQTSIARVIADDPQNPRDPNWVVGTHLLNHVGVAMKTHLIADMLHFVGDKEPMDENISDWATRRKIKVSYTRPSLVDHRDTPTMMEHHPSRFPEKDMKSRNEIRRAWLVGGRDKWDNTSVEMHYPPRLTVVK